MEKELEQRDSSIMRVVLYGPESTGATTLAKQLAAHYNTNWVPEYMRTYLENKTVVPGEEIVAYDEIDNIAHAQISSDNTPIKTASKLLCCDTKLLELQVHAEHYYGKCPRTLATYARKNKYELDILTDIDVPWQADEMRDRPENREEMFALFEQKLIDYNLPYITIKGNESERLKQAISYIDNHL